MAEIINFKNFNEFQDYNYDVLHEDFILNFYLISMMEKVEKREINVYDSFTITDTDGSYVMALWVDGCYLLFCQHWNDEVLTVLSTKIDLTKFKRFLFNGSKPFITSFFKANNANFHIVKDRIIYQCSKLTDPFFCSPGQLEMASMSDLDELAQMSFQYSQEEYQGKGRDYPHMRGIVEGGIAASNFFVWRDQGEICSIAQVIYNEEYPPFIGHLYTYPIKRSKGYASSLLHRMTEGLLRADRANCGLVSDATILTSNKVFLKVGYVPIGTYVSGTKEMWDEKDID